MRAARRSVGLKNRFSKDKLLGSKWTALHPMQKEKHFIVLDWDPKAPEQREKVLVEAVLTRRERLVPVSELRNCKDWRMGWH